MYTWKGMTKINYDLAVEMFENDFEVFLLYDDDTEGVATSLEEIEAHYKCGGEFGQEAC